MFRFPLWVTEQPPAGMREPRGRSFTTRRRRHCGASEGTQGVPGEREPSWDPNPGSASLLCFSSWPRPVECGKERRETAFTKQALTLRGNGLVPGIFHAVWGAKALALNYPEVIQEISSVQRAPRLCTVHLVPSSQPSLVSFLYIVTDLYFSYASRADFDTELKDIYLPKTPTK